MGNQEIKKKRLICLPNNTTIRDGETAAETITGRPLVFPKGWADGGVGTETAVGGMSLSEDENQLRF